MQETESTRRLIRGKEVWKRLISESSESTGHRARHSGRLPTSVEYLSACRGWSEHEVNALVRAIAAAAIADELWPLYTRPIAEGTGAAP